MENYKETLPKEMNFYIAIFSILPFVIYISSRILFDFAFEEQPSNMQKRFSLLCALLSQVSIFLYIINIKNWKLDYIKEKKSPELFSFKLIFMMQVYFLIFGSLFFVIFLIIDSLMPDFNFSIRDFIYSMIIIAVNGFFLPKIFLLLRSR